MKYRNNNGFTLIEMLVVVAIIGILAAVILTVFVSIRSKGRDAKRISSLREIAKGMAIYDNEPAKSMYTSGTSACPAHSLLTECLLAGTTLTNFASYPDVLGSVTPCPAQSLGDSPGSPCAASISRNDGGVSGSGLPNTQDWEVCMVLESGNQKFGGYGYGTGTSFGEVHVGSDTYGSIKAGCN